MYGLSAARAPALTILAADWAMTNRGHDYPGAGWHLAPIAIESGGNRLAVGTANQL